MSPDSFSRRPATTDDSNSDSSWESFRRDTRAVNYTLNAMLALTIFFAGLIIAFSSVVDLGDEFNQDVQQEKLETELSDVMDIIDTSDDLKAGLLYWDDPDGEWADLDPALNDSYVQLPQSHQWSGLFERLEERGISYGITVEYQTASGVTEQVTMASQGTPGANTVSQTKTIPIQDDDQLTGPVNVQVENANSFYAPDARPNSNRYNTLTVTVFIWR